MRAPTAANPPAYARLRLLLGAGSPDTGESMEEMIQREHGLLFAYQVHKDHMTKLVQVDLVVAVLIIFLDELEQLL